MNIKIVMTLINLLNFFKGCSPSVSYIPPIALLIYSPTFYKVYTSDWGDNDNSNVLLVLGLIVFLFYREWDKLIKIPAEPSPILGWFLFAVSQIIYTVGSSQDIDLFEIGSIIPYTLGVLLIFKGISGIKLLWFPMFFMFFMLPLPGAMVALLTMPMKIAVSTVAENILYYFDYPISREGVMLFIGQYKLLVADACSGLNTLLSLEAMGLLYVNLTSNNSLSRNIILGIFIIPISFLANVTRVITLVLLTYHGGVELGMGFLHSFAGMFMFCVALILIISFDNTLQKLLNYE